MTGRADLNRAAKAGAIAEVLRHHGFTAAEAFDRVMPDSDARQSIEWDAFHGTKRPASDETWAAAIAILKGAEGVADTDPFAGLPGC